MEIFAKAQLRVLAVRLRLLLAATPSGTLLKLKRVRTAMPSCFRIPEVIELNLIPGMAKELTPLHPVLYAQKGLTQEGLVMCRASDLTCEGLLLPKALHVIPESEMKHMVRSATDLRLS